MKGQSHERRDPTQPVKPRRPRLIKLIFWMVMVWAVLGWLRFFGAMTQQSFIKTLLPPELYWWILITGLVWGFSGLPLLWGLMYAAPWTPFLLKIAIVTYSLSYWFERLVLWKNPYAQRNWPFMLLLTGAWVGLVFGTMALRHVKTYFKNVD